MTAVSYRNGKACLVLRLSLIVALLLPRAHSLQLVIVASAYHYPESLALRFSLAAALLLGILFLSLWRQ